MTRETLLNLAIMGALLAVPVLAHVTGNPFTITLATKVAILALAAVLVAMLFVYLARFRPGFWASDRRVALLGVILIIAVIPDTVYRLDAEIGQVLQPEISSGAEGHKITVFVAMVHDTRLGGDGLVGRLKQGLGCGNIFVSHIPLGSSSVAQVKFP